MRKQNMSYSRTPIYFSIFVTWLGSGSKTKQRVSLCCFVVFDWRNLGKIFIDMCQVGDRQHWRLTLLRHFTTPPLALGIDLGGFFFNLFFKIFLILKKYFVRVFFIVLI
jgi:hypothetical protein